LVSQEERENNNTQTAKKLKFKRKLKNRRFKHRESFCKIIF
jgi:hypothetical protein